MIQIKMFPAKDGDSFLIKAGSQLNSHILIDGGFSDTFRKFVKPELAEIASRNGKLGLVVVSHIDEDHIRGIIKLVEINGSSSTPSIIEIENIWHNSIRAITNYESNIDSLAPKDKNIINRLNSLNYSTPNQDGNISAKQGSALAKLLVQNSYHWNFGEGYQPICKEVLPCFSLNAEISFQLLTPNQEILNLLKRHWEKELRNRGFIGNISESVFDDGFEFLLSREKNIVKSELITATQNLEKAYIPDTSITNRSSISFVLQSEGKRILFLGDAWAEDVEQSLIDIYGAQEKIVFDAIKISHHGSRSNTSVRLLELIDSPIFLISTMGKKHGHPDMPVLLEIVKRNASFKRKIYFSENNKRIETLKKFEEEFNFEVINASNGWIKI